jgi:cystathionine beta-synthase
MFAALTVARELPDESVVVVLFPDTGRNYLSKLYSETWMLQYGFLERPEAIRIEEVLVAKHGTIPPVVAIDAHAKVRQAIDRLREFEISQAPVVRDASGGVSSVVGSVREPMLLDRLFRDPDALQADVAEVMAPPFPVLDFDAAIEAAVAELQQGPAVLVTKGGEMLGILTRADLLEFLAHRRAAGT